MNRNAISEGRPATVLVNVGQNERLASIIGGLALALYGLSRLSISMVAALAGGAYLLYRGVYGRCYIYEALDINKAIWLPPEKVSSAE